MLPCPPRVDASWLLHNDRSFSLYLPSALSATVRIIRYDLETKLIMVEVSAAYRSYSAQQDDIKMSGKEMVHGIVIYLELANAGAQCRIFLNSRRKLGFHKIREYLQT